MSQCRYLHAGCGLETEKIDPIQRVPLSNPRSDDHRDLQRGVSIVSRANLINVWTSYRTDAHRKLYGAFFVRMEELNLAGVCRGLQTWEEGAMETKKKPSPR